MLDNRVQAFLEADNSVLPCSRGSRYHDLSCRQRIQGNYSEGCGVNCECSDDPDRNNRPRYLCKDCIEMKADILIRFLKVFLRNPVLEKKEVVKGKIRDQMRRGNRECINIPKFDATALYVYDGQSAETQEIMRKQGIAPERALKRPVKRCPDRKEGMLRDYTKPKSTRRGKITPAVKNDVLPTVNAAVIKKCEKANVPLHMNLPIRSRDAEATAPGAFPLPAGCAANISRKISRWVDKDNFRIYRQRERSRSPNAKDETEMDQRERERPKGRIMRMHTRAIDELAEHLADTHVEFAGEEKNDLEIRENLDPFGLN